MGIEADRWIQEVRVPTYLAVATAHRRIVAERVSPLETVDCRARHKLAFRSDEIVTGIGFGKNAVRNRLNARVQETAHLGLSQSLITNVREIYARHAKDAIHVLLRSHAVPPRGVQVRRRNDVWRVGVDFARLEAASDRGAAEPVRILVLKQGRFPGHINTSVVGVSRILLVLLLLTEAGDADRQTVVH